MSYRLVQVGSFYQGYLDDFYRRNPDDPSLSYEVQLARLMADGFGAAGFLVRRLCDVGVEAHEVVSNARPLQAAWARENGVAPEAPDLLVRQLAALRPDVLVIQDHRAFSAASLGELRRAVPGLRCVVAFCCAPYGPDELDALRACDAVITCTPGFAEDFRVAGLDAILLYHAFEGDLVPGLAEDNPFPELDLLFVGSLMPGSGMHRQRREIIERLAAATDALVVFGTVVEEPVLRVMAKRALYRVAATLRAVGVPEGALRSVPGLRRASQWRELPSRDRVPRALRRRVRPPLFGIAMLKALSRARVGLNIHIDVAGRFAGNVRLFETTGAGACLLTDWKENMPSLFEPDSEAVCYRSPEECLEKFRWLLDHPRERVAIARAGQARTLRDHGYLNRARELDHELRQRLRGHPVAARA